jgi:hypothetical protein
MARRVKIEGNASNIVNVYRSATPEQVAKGRRWYGQFFSDVIRTAARAGFRVQTRSDVSMVCGLAAAFSIQRSPNVNLWHLFFFLTEAAAGRLDVSIHTGTQDTKARRIYNGADPLDVLTGPKERSFYSNIIGDGDAVTIDGHAWSVWTGTRTTTDKVKVPPGGPRREACVEDYRQAAAILGTSARDVQAVTWVTWRDMHQSESDKTRLGFGKGQWATIL